MTFRFRRVRLSPMSPADEPSPPQPTPPRIAWPEPASSQAYTIARLCWILAGALLAGWMLFVFSGEVRWLPWYGALGLIAVMLLGLIAAVLSLFSPIVRRTNGSLHAAAGLVLNLIGMSVVALTMLVVVAIDSFQAAAQRARAAQAANARAAAQRPAPGINPDFADLSLTERDPFKEVSADDPLFLKHNLEAPVPRSNQLDLPRSDSRPPGPRFKPVTLPKIVPPRLGSARVEYALPAAALDACVAGGGRYLIFRLAGSSELAVFDVNRAEITRRIDVAASEFLFTAGAQWLIVVLPKDRVVQRWNLATGEREATRGLSSSSPVIAAVMGSASNGPVLLIHDRLEEGNDRHQFLDPDTLEPVAYKLQWTPYVEGLSSKGGLARAAADGQAFAILGQEHGEWYLCTALTDGPDVRRNLAETVVSPWLSISSGGELVCLRSGLYGSQTQPLQVANEKNITTCFLPAVQGKLYLGIPCGSAPDGVGLHLQGDRRRLAILPGITLRGPDVSKPEGTKLTFDKRVFLIPDAELLVTVADDKSRLLLDRIDTRGLLDASPVDYVSIDSVGPSHASGGNLYQYQVTARSAKKPVTFRWVAGPGGLAVSPTGQVRWQVPSNQAARSYDVVLEARSPSGATDLQAYALQVSDATGLTSPGESVRPDPLPVLHRPQLRPVELPAWPAPGKPESTEVALPGVVHDLVVAGNGRYLLMYFAALQRVAVYDVAAGKIVHTLSAPDDAVKIAGGADKFVLVLANKRLIARYDLASGKLEQVGRMRDHYPAVWAAMGPASNGPLYVGHCNSISTGDGYHRLDLYDLQTLYPVLEKGQPSGMVDRRYYPRASADGTVVSCNCDEPMFDHRLSVLSDYELKQFHFEATGSGRGKLFSNVTFGRRTLLFADQCRPFYSHYKDRDMVVLGWGTDYYLQVDPPPAAKRASGSGSVRLRLFPLKQPIARLADAPLLTSNLVQFARVTRSRLPLDKRYFLIPGAKQLITLPLSGDRLLVRPVDPDAELARADLDYLAIPSDPPATASPGSLYQYTCRVLSRHGGVQFRLESGPPQMQLSPTGDLTWPVPEASPKGPVDVVLSVKDASGKQEFQSFKVQVQRPTPAVALKVRKATETNPLRTWRSRGHRFEVEARFLEIAEGNRVVLRTADDRLIVVSFHELSPVDADMLLDRVLQKP